MKIIERYPAGLKAFHGKGIWSLLYPLRSVLSFFYDIYLSSARGKSVPFAAGIVKTNEGAKGNAPFVISIGNLEAGGGGKTPVTVALAGMIRDSGGSAAVVTRGYGSVAEKKGLPVAVYSRVPVAEGDRQVTGSPADRGTDRAGDIPGHTTDSTLFEESVFPGESKRAAMTRIVGDEVMIYRSRMIPVVIDSDRNRGIALAAKLYSPTHVLLDDAFQNHSVRKDVDLLLLDAQKPLGNGRLLPAGTLREKPEAILRADIVILTRSVSRMAGPRIGKYLAGKPVFFSKHIPAGLVARDGNRVPDAVLKDRRAAIFCGIAKPDSFEGTVVSMGVEPAVSFRFEDHHRYCREDIDFMSANSPEDSVFITTEKDWNKSVDLFPGDIDLFALRMEVDIAGKEKLLPLIGFQE